MKPTKFLGALIAFSLIALASSGDRANATDRKRVEEYEGFGVMVRRPQPFSDPAYTNPEFTELYGDNPLVFPVPVKRDDKRGKKGREPTTLPSLGPGSDDEGAGGSNVLFEDSPPTQRRYRSNEGKRQEKKRTAPQVLLPKTEAKYIPNADENGGGFESLRDSSFEAVGRLSDEEKEGEGSDSDKEKRRGEESKARRGLFLNHGDLPNDGKKKGGKFEESLRVSAFKAIGHQAGKEKGYESGEEKGTTFGTSPNGIEYPPSPNVSPLRVQTPPPPSFPPKSLPDRKVSEEELRLHERYRTWENLPVDKLNKRIEENRRKYEDENIRDQIAFQRKVYLERQEELKEFNKKREELPKEIKEKQAILDERDALIREESITDIKSYIADLEEDEATYKRTIAELTAANLAPLSPRSPRKVESPPVSPRKLEGEKRKLARVQRKLLLLRARPSTLRVEIEEDQESLRELEQQQQPPSGLSDDPVLSPSTRENQYRFLRMETIHPLPSGRLFTAEQTIKALEIFGFPAELLSKINVFNFARFCEGHVSLPSYKQPQARDFLALYKEEIKKIKELYAARLKEDVFQMIVFAAFSARSSSSLDRTPLDEEAMKVIQDNKLIDLAELDLDKIEGEGHAVFRRHVQQHFQFGGDNTLLNRSYQVVPNHRGTLFKYLCLAIQDRRVDPAETDDRKVIPIAAAMERLYNSGESCDLLPEYEEIFLGFFGRIFNNILYDIMLSNFDSGLNAEQSFRPGEKGQGKRDKYYKG